MPLEREAPDLESGEGERLKAQRKKTQRRAKSGDRKEQPQAPVRGESSAARFWNRVIANSMPPPLPVEIEYDGDLSEALERVTARRKAKELGRKVEELAASSAKAPVLLPKKETNRPKCRKRSPESKRLKGLILTVYEQHPDYEQRKICGKIDNLCERTKTESPLLPTWKSAGATNLVGAFDMPKLRSRVKKFISIAISNSKS
jgi:hypothetical protein